MHGGFTQKKSLKINQKGFVPFIVVIAAVLVSSLAAAGYFSYSYYISNNQTQNQPILIESSPAPTPTSTASPTIKPSSAVKASVKPTVKPTAKPTTAPNSTPSPTQANSNQSNNPSIALDSVSPNETNTETQVTLKGHGFGSNRGEILMLTAYNSLYGANVDSWSDSEVKATIPFILTSNQNLQIYVKTSNGQESNKQSLRILQGEPIVNSESPGNVTPGGTLTLNGEGFGSSQGQVAFYTNAQTQTAGTVQSWSASKIVVTIPSSLISGQDYGIQVVSSANTHSSLVYYHVGN